MQHFKKQFRRTFPVYDRCFAVSADTNEPYRTIARDAILYAVHAHRIIAYDAIDAAYRETISQYDRVIVRGMRA